MRDELQECFSNISWAYLAGAESRSGSGSTLEFTQNIRNALPKLFRFFNVKTFVDAPCGDWNWMQKTDLSGVQYHGADIVEEIVAQNQLNFGGPDIRFSVRDITSDPLPSGDLLMVRDCLMHLEDKLVWAFLENFADSDVPFLLTTSYQNAVNSDIDHNGGFRELNLRAAPFNFERHIVSVVEPQEWWANFSDRHMGVWSRTQVRQALRDRELSKD